jgi:dolichyl-phosphate-mannose-protein mannosyltransferase
MPQASSTRIRPELIVISVFSALMHFWHLFTPNVVAWDEIHFERHAGHYLAGTHYFDVHPPLGKLLFAAEARFFGIPASTLLGGAPATALRILPALLGALVAPLVYVLLRQLGAARRVATLGAFAVLFENALLVDMRLALLEPFLISFGLCAITLFLAARHRQASQRLALLALSAVFAGCAISVKWTGASALGVILTTWLFDVWSTRPARPPAKRMTGELSLMVGIPIVIYVASFAIHFALLRHSGVDDAVMSGRFRATLIGNPAYVPEARMSLFAKLRDVHRAMARGNRTLEYVVHPASSPWYTWPIMKHPILFWQSGTQPRSSLILLGNPVVWWGGGIAVLVAGALLWRRRDRLRRHQFAIAFLVGGFLLNYVPFIAIRRVMYLYHYLFSLVWLAALAVMGLSVVASWNEPGDDVLCRFTSRRSAILYWSVAGAVLVGFLFFLPFTYGWPLGQAAYDARFWVLHPHLP